ncbi:hypothetical protein D6C99_03084 [Aureobasidium pullulans]|nr:hypothetical protein D6C99_03084 [Aureobasidium pullulans]
MAVHTPHRLPIVLAVAASLLFIIAAFHQRGGVPNAKKLWHRPSFYEVAAKYGTDKVTAHSYHHMYEKYLPAVRMKRIKMLEIGLGCDMGYGPGASYNLWLEYFPYVDLYSIEYDERCARKWARKTSGATIFTGDQADEAFLEEFITDSGGDFDIIIDDGGHTMNQQIKSLEHLWKTVKPGGYYFCEDMQTSYWDSHGGGPTASKENGNQTFVQLVNEMVEDLNSGNRRVNFDGAEEVLGVDCMAEVCGFWKRPEGPDKPVKLERSTKTGAR